MNGRFCCAACVPGCLLVLGGLYLLGGERPAPPAGKTDQVDPRWSDRLDDSDRACLDGLIGYAPAAFTQELRWFGSEPLTWKQLRGKVAVVQTWTSQTTAGRKWLSRTSQALADFRPDDLQLIALHTPEGADKVQRFLDRSRADVPVVIDPTGSFCDGLGVYKKPVNIVVDRNGVVRYAGLKAAGLARAVAGLISEPFEANRQPRSRPAPPPTPAEFPPFQGGVGRALDVRGKSGPEFFVEQWVTERPNADGKVIVLDFWATWCPPCRSSIPHMNALADRFGDQVCVIGVSNEPPAKFQLGLQRYRLDLNRFHYALALDPSGRMQRVVGIRGIPHALVLSSDWVVRWQGHPATLTAETLGRIVAANGEALASNDRCQRWTSG